MSNRLCLLVVCLFLTQMGWTQNYVAQLRGNHEVMPVLSNASGSISAVLLGDTLQVSGSFSGIRSGVDTTIAGGAHIHMGMAGENGGVVVALAATFTDSLTSGTFEAEDNTFVLDSTALAALIEHSLYVNIHSHAVPSGEVRGQLIPEGGVLYTSNLFGSNHGASVMSRGRGSLVVVHETNQAVVSGTIHDLSSPIATEIAGGAHLHSGLAGQNGGIVAPLTMEISEDGRSARIKPSENTFALSEIDSAALSSEAIYANIHSQNHPSGELRGQVTAAAQMKFRVHLSGANHTPQTGSFAHGKMAVAVRDGAMTISGSIADLESELNTDILGGVHVHMGMAGQSGPVLFPLTVEVSGDSRVGAIRPENNVYPVAGDTISTLTARGLYINVHSVGHPEGEIRGQLLPESQFFMQAQMTGSQEVLPVETQASGSVVVEVMGHLVTLSGSYNNLSSPLATQIAGGSHIHVAPAGSNGPLVEALEVVSTDEDSGIWPAAENTFPMPNSDTLRARDWYVNLHTDAHGSGEIRGQLLHEALAYFHAPLSGAEEVPAVPSPGSGAVLMEYNGRSSAVSGSFSGLASPVNTAIAGGAHIHVGRVGQNGPLLQPLSLLLNEDMTSAKIDTPSIFFLNRSAMDSVRNRMMYVNVHTIGVSSGEIRGNFRPLAQSYYLANLRGKNSVPPHPSTALGAVLFERNGNQIGASGSFSNLNSGLATDLGGGAHLHLGMPDTVGAVIVALNSQTGEDSTSGVFQIDSNLWILPDSVVSSFVAGHHYVNVRSIDEPAGEVRGQVLHEINFSPATPHFIEPGSGDSIAVGIDTTQEFLVRWDSVMDPNGNQVVYLWQLAAAPDFTGLSLTLNTGTDPSFRTSIGVVDTLLSLIGVDTGQSITLYHRVVASDGSLCSLPATDSVIFTRGATTSVIDNPYVSEGLNLFPNPVHDEMRIEVDMKRGARVDAYIMDLSGRVLMHREYPFSEGVNRRAIGVAQLPAGSYILQLTIDNTLGMAKAFLKK